MDRVDHFGRDLLRRPRPRGPPAAARPARGAAARRRAHGAPARRHRAAVDARAGRRARGRSRGGGGGLRPARRRGLPRGAPRVGHARGEGGAGAAAPAAAPVARMPSVRFDLRPESAERGAFPRGPWLAATRRALAAAPDADLGYGAWAGRAGRCARSLAAYLGRARGVVAAARRHRRHRRASPRRSRCSPGSCAPAAARRVIVEEPGFWQHRTILQRAGLELVPVDVDDGGLRTEALPRARRPRSSRRRTSSPPARSSPPSAARRCSTGRPPTTPS